MFDSYASGGKANASANNYLKINAISGTLIKNHPKSIFVRASSDNPIFDPTNPRCIFPKAKECAVTESYQTHYIPGRGWEYETYQTKVKKDAEVPCIVLQAMLIGEDSFLCEIVTKDDFYNVESDVYGENTDGKN